MRHRALRPLLVAGLLAGVADAATAGDDALDITRGSFRAELNGYVQLDGRAFADWGGVADPERRDDAEVRRLRLGIDAGWGPVRAQVEADPADRGDVLKDMWAEVGFARVLRLRAGHLKVPVSAEHLTSASRLDFVERSMLADVLAPTRDWGVLLRSQVAEAARIELGLFAGDGSAKSWRAGTTVAGRIEVGPWRGVEAGLSASRGEVGDDPEEARGLEGQVPSGWEFFAHHFVSGTRLRLGADAAYRAGPLRVSGEWLRVREERTAQGGRGEDLPAEIGQGFCASATVQVAGEKRRGAGAVELGLRWERLAFDDAGDGLGFEGLGTRSRNLRPVAASALTVGVSFSPHALLRVTGNVVRESYAEPLTAPAPDAEAAYLTFVGRLQVRLP